MKQGFSESLLNETPKFKSQMFWGQKLRTEWLFLKKRVLVVVKWHLDIPDSLITSWEKVSEDTIKPCFKHIAFQNPDEMVVEMVAHDSKTFHDSN